MKPRSTPAHHFSRLFLSLSIAAPMLVSFASAAAYTWDGGDNTSTGWATATNWSTDIAPAATGDTLTFAGTNNLSAVNNVVTSLATTGTAITFASGAGAFTLSGNALTLGSGGGGGQTIISQQSANNQTISANINLSGGNGDRSIVFGAGAGSLTLSGNIAFNGDWLFPTTTAGTIVLSGANTGDGKTTNAITAGTNVMRAMMRNNVAGTQLMLGSDGALGNSGTGIANSGTASLRGIIANQNMKIGTANGNRDLSGSSLAINAGNIDFNGTSNLTIGNIVTVAGNRDFLVSSTGAVTVAGGIFLSADQTGRQLFVNLTGAGGMIVNGSVADTFHSGGVTTGSSTLRKSGTGMMTLNGNSSFTGATQIEAGTLKIGHANALGATGTTSATNLTGGTLDLNGFTIGETINVTVNSSLANSGATAQLTADTNLSANLVVNATGDITATRLIGTAAIRTITKTGAGTLTTNGTSHNNLSSWNIQAGKVVLANTSGYGADRGVAINGGSLQLSGSNSDLINNNEAFTVNTGTFDLNGKSEAVASIGGSGGTIRNSLAASTSTLYVGSGPGGSTSASYAGVIENGAGTLKLTKEGSGTQTLTGTNTYTGATTISGGTLALGSTGSIDGTSGVSLGTSGTFDVSAKSGGYTVAALTGSGNVIGALTVSTTLAIGNSPGTTTFSSDLTIGAGATSTFEFTDTAFTGGTFDLAQGGVGAQNVDFGGGTLNLLFSGGSYVDNSTVQIFNFESYSGSFGSVSFTGLDLGQSAVFDSSTGYVTITAVPEPNAAMLLGGLGVLALLRRRRN